MTAARGYSISSRLVSDITRGVVDPLMCIVNKQWGSDLRDVPRVLVVMRGLPGCGKTPLAETIVEYAGEMGRLHDLLREPLFHGEWSIPVQCGRSWASARGLLQPMPGCAESSEGPRTGHYYRRQHEPTDSRF
jgi:hypothetical protein